MLVKTFVLHVGKIAFLAAFMAVLYMSVKNLVDQKTGTQFTLEKKESNFPGFTICPKGYLTGIGYAEQLGEQNLNSSFILDLMGNSSNVKAPDWLSLHLERFDDKNK